MSIEGGKFSCTLHSFETEDVSAWDNHCYGDPDHALEVTKICINCAEEGIKTEFKDPKVPYPKKYVEKAHKKNTTGVLLKCPTCGELT